MEEPRLTVIGVYRPQISPETWQEQWAVSADDRATKEHFDHLVLIEATVSGLSERFDMIKFGQPDVNHPEHDGMQVGYDEGLLNADGTALIIREIDCLEKATCPLRFAVFLHFFDPERPLHWQRGEVQCPTISELPARLVKLMPYRVV